MNALCLCLMAVLGVSLPYEQDFEGGLEGLKADGWRVPQGVTIEKDDAKEGNACLRVQHTATRYVVLFVPVETGKFYGADVRMRCEDVGASAGSGSNRGAVIFLQFADRDKQWVGGGSFPQGLHGTHDWTRREVPYTRRIPPEVAYLHVMIGIEGSGTAWFDEFRVYEIDSWDGIKLTSPKDGATVDVRRPLLEWRTDDDHARAGSVYVSRAPDFPDAPGQTFATPSGDGTSRPARWLEPGTWYWRVQPVRGGLELPPSEVASFVVAEDAAMWPPDIVPRWSWDDAPRPVLMARVSESVKRDQIACAVNGAAAEITGFSDGELKFQPRGTLAPGIHSVTITVTGSKDRIKTVKGVFSNKAPGCRVSIRDDRVLLVDGEPFFPLGAYRDPSDTLTKFEGLKEAGFNVTHSYTFEGQTKPDAAVTARAYLQAAHENGLNVFMGFDRGKVRALDHEWIARWTAELMDEPALLTWYLMDEPAGQGVPVDVVAGIGQTVKDVDPFHPTSLVMCVPRAFGEYAPACDILWNDPYPLPGRPLTMVDDWARQGMAAAGPGQPYWIVLQGHDLRFWHDKEGAFKKYGAPDQPTPVQTRCMAYTGLADGANAIIWYWAPNSIYHIQKDAPTVWRGICDTVQELRGYMHYLVARRTPADGLEVPDPLRVWTRQAGGKRILAVVNTSDAAWEGQLDVSALKAGVLSENGVSDGDALGAEPHSLTLQGHEVRVFEGSAAAN